MSKKIKDSELKNILAEVETEIAALLKTEAASLMKSGGPGEDDGGSEGGEGSAPASEGSEGGGDEGGGDDAPAAATAPEASAPAEGSAAPAPEASAPAADPAMDAGPVDPEALKAEYAKLPPEELKMHYLAAKTALFEVMGAADPSAGDPAAAAGAPPAGPAAPMAPGPEASAAPAPAPMAPPAPAPEASAAPGQDPMAALKAEVPASFKNNPAQGGTEKAAVPDAIEKSIKKSEDASKIAELEVMVEGLTKAIDMLVGQPLQKAVTRASDVAYVPKTASAPAQLSKKEVETRLVNLVKAEKLNATQRERVVSFCLGNITQEAVSDLLEIK